jgi:hypothetical protein
MDPRRTYTTEFKLDAQRLLETSGKSAAHIEPALELGDRCLLRRKKRLEMAGMRTLGMAV